MSRAGTKHPGRPNNTTQNTIKQAGKGVSGEALKKQIVYMIVLRFFSFLIRLIADPSGMSNESTSKG